MVQAQVNPSSFDSLRLTSTIDEEFNKLHRKMVQAIESGQNTITHTFDLGGVPTDAAKQMVQSKLQAQKGFYQSMTADVGPNNSVVVRASVPSSAVPAEPAPAMVPLSVNISMSITEPIKTLSNDDLMKLPPDEIGTHYQEFLKQFDVQYRPQILAAIETTIQEFKDGHRTRDQLGILPMGEKNDLHIIPAPLNAEPALAMASFTEVTPGVAQKVISQLEGVSGFHSVDPFGNLFTFDTEGAAQMPGMEARDFTRSAFRSANDIAAFTAQLDSEMTRIPQGLPVTVVAVVTYDKNTKADKALNDKLAQTANAQLRDARVTFVARALTCADLGNQIQTGDISEQNWAAIQKTLPKNLAVPSDLLEAKQYFTAHPTTELYLDQSVPEVANVYHQVRSVHIQANFGISFDENTGVLSLTGQNQDLQGMVGKPMQLQYGGKSQDVTVEEPSPDRFALTAPDPAHPGQTLELTRLQDILKLTGGSEFSIHLHMPDGSDVTKVQSHRVLSGFTVLHSMDPDISNLMGDGNLKNNLKKFSDNGLSGKPPTPAQRTKNMAAFISAEHPPDEQTTAFLTALFQYQTDQIELPALLSTCGIGQERGAGFETARIAPVLEILAALSKDKGDELRNSLKLRVKDQSHEIEGGMTNKPHYETCVVAGTITDFLHSLGHSEVTHEDVHSFIEENDGKTQDEALGPQAVADWAAKPLSVRNSILHPQD